MASVFGSKIKITIDGSSHGPYVCGTLEGFPNDIAVDPKELACFMAKRSSDGVFGTKRIESDAPIFSSGYINGKTDGNKIVFVIENKNYNPDEYANIKYLPRPSHADYAAYVKYGEIPSGGGCFSGRMTAPMCVAGFFCMEYLKKYGVEISAHLLSAGGINDKSLDSLKPDISVLKNLKKKKFPVIDPEIEKKIKSEIKKAASDGDSLGGIVEVAVYGLPAGIGGPMYEGLEGLISQAIFAIPGVEGIEFGIGFGMADKKGSNANDVFTTESGEIKTVTNNCGGILGGISSGMPLIFRAAFKPTPSIAVTQDTVNLKTGEIEKLTVCGRHDPCIAVRATPVCAAAAAMAIVNGDFGWN